MEWAGTIAELYEYLNKRSQTICPATTVWFIYSSTSGAADAVHFKSDLGKFVGIKNVATVEDECRLVHVVMNLLEVEPLEFIPFVRTATAWALKLASCASLATVTFDSMSRR